MPSIGDVGDELRRAVEQIEEAAASAGRAEHDAAEALANVNAATESSLSYVAEEGRSLWQQALERLAEALALFKGGQDTMTAYIASITASGGGAGSPGQSPNSVSQPTNLSGRRKGVPNDWTEREADNGKGTVYQDPNASGNANMFRLMDPTGRYPNGYVRFYNEHGQPIGSDGKPGSRSETHIPINDDGTYAVPEGWSR